MESAPAISARQHLAQNMRRGANCLSTEARRRTADYIRRQLNPDGGFRGRAKVSDLYYTVFGLECALALELELPWPIIQNYARQQTVDALDFVHLSCLARCVELLWPANQPPPWLDSMKNRLASHACAGGGYHRELGQKNGAIYDSFLGLLAGESLKLPFPHPDQMALRLANLRQRSGGYLNTPGLGAATTPVTAAAFALHHELHVPIAETSIQWLLDRQHKSGGFGAAALVPLPDLLSTATALQALFGVDSDVPIQVQQHLEFVLSLYDESGGFVGHRFDRTPDCEYTFYGLLALGNLTASG